MPHDPFLGFEMKIYYQNEHKFKCVHSKRNLSKIKDEAYTAEKVKKCLMENFIFYALIETVIALYVNCDYVTYCDNFRIDYIPK